MELLKVNQSSYYYYTKKVKGNRKASLNEVQRKLSRNLALSLLYKINKDKIWYAYGELRFAVKDDTVVWIENGHSTHPKWKKDMVKYEELSKLLGLRRTHKV